MESEQLKEVCRALDSGISDSISSRAEISRSSLLSRYRVKNPLSDENNHVEVEEYCRMLKESHDESAVMDSRSLIPKEQSKLDSLHTPHSETDLYDRIKSYSVSKWAQKPDCISALHCARYGWKLSEWDFLSCVSCKQILHIPSDTTKLTGREWAIKLRKDVETQGHLPTCPWTRLPSPLDLISLPKGPELKKYLQETSEAFLSLSRVPQLTTGCIDVIEQLDTEWMYDQETTESLVVNTDLNAVRKTVLFLVINGWSISVDHEIMICKLCLREIPLRMFDSRQEGVPEASIENPSPWRDVVLNTSKQEFCPISNHWSWCPWRRALAGVLTKNNVSNFGTTEVNEVSISSPSHNPPQSTSYASFVQSLKIECESGIIKYDCTKPNTGLLSSIVSLMDSCVTKRSITFQTEDISTNPSYSESDRLKEKQGGSSLAGPVTNNDCGSPANNVRKGYEDMPPKKRIRRELFDTFAGVI